MDKVGQAIAKAQAEQKREEQFQTLIAKVDALTAQVTALLAQVNALTAPPVETKSEAKGKKG